MKEERVKLEASIDRERANDSAEEAAEILDLIGEDCRVGDAVRPAPGRNFKSQARKHESED